MASSCWDCSYPRLRAPSPHRTLLVLGIPKVIAITIVPAMPMIGSHHPQDLQPLRQALQTVDIIGILRRQGSTELGDEDPIGHLRQVLLQLRGEVLGAALTLRKPVGVEVVSQEASPSQAGNDLDGSRHGIESNIENHRP